MFGTATSYGSAPSPRNNISGFIFPGIDLGVAGLSDQAAMRCPAVLEFENDFLQGRCWH
jgi:hypothetical protein